MTNSFYNGVSGIKTQSVGVDIIAHNMANVNTIGFKRTGSEFADIFYRRVASQSTNPTESGGGAMVSATKVVYEQSGVMQGDGEFDVALNGKGFFGVMGYNQFYYTRNGEFVRDAYDNLVDSSGNYVLGAMNPNLTNITYSDRVAEEMGRINGTPVSSGWTINNPNESFAITRNTRPTSLFVPRNMYYYPEVTTQATFKGTLSSRKAATNVDLSDTFSQGITITPPTAPATAYTISGELTTNDVYSAAVGDKISIKVQDRDGTERTIEAELTAIQEDGIDSRTRFGFSVEFEPSTGDTEPTIVSSSLNTQQDFLETRTFGARIYNADGTVSILRYELEAVQPRTAGDITFNITAFFEDTAGNKIADAGTGTMTFNEYGALISHTLQSVQNPNGGTISVNFGTPTNTPSTNGTGAGWDGVYLRLNSNDADAVDYTSDGIAEGFFDRYQIDTDGSVLAQFTNGRVVTVAKLALYNFINEQGLASLGSNNFLATSNSGPASFLFDAEGNFIYTANFVGNRLELSNVDLSTELTNLIVMQRAFEASSKSVTTSDDMIQTAIGLKK